MDYDGTTKNGAAMSKDGYLSPELIETLMHMHECETLDFKGDQYPIDNATNEEKGEFVKDLIAFANAWKTSDAYILIGVEEVPGSRANVFGISQHVDDAKLQQLINSKTNVPVRFSYIPVSVDEKPVGVIRIEQEQQRPVYSKKDFGKLKKDTVYIRRGSSTGEASVDEIARMGAVSNSSRVQCPNLELEFGLESNGEHLGATLAVSPILFTDSHSSETVESRSFLREQSKYALRRSIQKLFSTSHEFNFAPTRSPLEIKDYIQECVLLVPIGFCVKNTGNVVAHDVRAKITIPYVDDLIVIEEDKHPKHRYKHPMYLSGGILSNNRDLKLKTMPNSWVIEVSFGKVQPKAVAWSYDSLYIGSRKSLDLTLAARVFDDNITEPIDTPLTLEIRPQEVEYDPQKWAELDGDN